MTLRFRGSRHISQASLEIVERSINAGLALGQLEGQKRQLEQESAESDLPSAGDAKRAQYEWIDLAKLVVKNADRGLKKQKLTQREHDALLAPLLSAIEIAERRSAKPEEATTPTKEEK